MTINTTKPTIVAQENYTLSATFSLLATFVLLLYRLKVAEPKVAEPKVAQTKGCQTKVAKPNCGPSALRGFLTGTTGT